MKLPEVIKRLEQLKEKHGNLDCYAEGDTAWDIREIVVDTITDKGKKIKVIIFL